MRFFPLLLLSCLTCVGQPGPIALRSIDAWASAAPNKFDLAFTGLVVSNRWLSATLNPTNAVSDWIDPTNNFHLTQSTAGFQPTNSALGVRFNKNGSGSEKKLVSTNVFQDGNRLLYFIVRVDSDNVGGFNGICFDTGAGAPGIIEFTPSSGLSIQAGNYTMGGKISLDVYQDFILDAGGGSPKIWTNGVQVTPTGSSWYSFSTANGIVGNASTHDYLAGYLAELIVFTNKTITSGQASNLHYYRTNVYGGSP